MGRKRDFVSRNFFTIYENQNLSECRICKKKFNGIYISNIKRHLQEKHKDLYEKELCNQTVDKKSKYYVHFSQNDVKDACIDLITTEKMPFSVLDSKAFKALTGQIFNGLDMNPISSKNIMALISDKYNEIKCNMKLLLKEKVLCLKMDTATRHNRGILGVNVQLYIENKILVKTLGLIELNKRQSAENLCLEIEGILNEFNIEKKQIYCVTTDNGRNMVKTIEILNKNDDNLNGSEADLDDEQMLNGLCVNSITSIKCAAHTLQLAIKDFLQKINESHETINKARKLAKLLRTPSYRYTIIAQGLNQPEIDVATRWNSTYCMLKKLIEFEGFCEEREELGQILNISDWNTIKSLLNILEPAYILTLKLQSEQLYLGDFYKIWLELVLTVKGKNEYSTILENCLQKREEVLMENKIVIAAIYLDPRIRRVLIQKPTYLMIARNHLKKLIIQIYSVRNNNNNKSSSPNCQNNVEEFLEYDCTKKSSLLNEFLNSIEVNSSDEDDDINDDINKAISEIDHFNPKPISLDKDIMMYWEEKKFIYPHLYELAKVVHSVPATQVSVERSFSALKLVLTDLRCNLSAESLKKILFVKLNN